MFAASGSGAMESAVANLAGPGDAVLVARCGRFGERWKELCEAYGAAVTDLEVEWGSRIEPEDLDRALTAAPGGELEAIFVRAADIPDFVADGAADVAGTGWRDNGTFG